MLLKHSRVSLKDQRNVSLISYQIHWLLYVNNYLLCTKCKIILEDTPAGLATDELAFNVIILQ